jgi:glycosyltransferase involved in cell wall biosynthesis
MRVVLTVPSLEPKFGGPSLKAKALAGALRDMGVEATVAGCGSTSDGVFALPIAARFHGTPIPRTVGPFREMLRGADGVHIFGYRDPVGTIAAFEARGSRVPYILEPVGMHRRRLRSLRLKALYDAAMGRRVVEEAAAIVATSRLEAEELTADGVKPAQIHVRPNGVNLKGLIPLPERGTFRQRAGIPDGAPLVLALGRIAAKKGLLDLARALAALPATWGAILGPDDRDGTVRRLFDLRLRLDLGDRLRIVPEGKWGPEKAQALADADVFCLPSATENFGNAAAEAACLGMPVIVSDLCGVAEYLDPTGGQVVPYGNVEALTGAISEALTAEVQNAAKTAAAALRNTLDWRILARKQVEIYRGVLEGTPVQARSGGAARTA